MDTPSPLEQRLIDLEIKASYTDDLLDRLNEEVVRQQAQIDLLKREIGRLQQLVQDGTTGPARSLRDELPPHY
jgi:SlyX protein